MITLANGRFRLVDFDRMWTCDPVADAWAPGPAWPRGAGRSIVAMPDGRIAAIRDACDGTRPAAQLIVVDPSSGSWIDGPELPAPMETALLALAATDTVGVFGGYQVVPERSGSDYSDEVALPGPLLLALS